MKGLFGSVFDFNHDGNMSTFQRAAELSFLHEMLGEDENGKTELELSGLDPDEYDKEAIMVKLEGLGNLGM